jgi:hypothetical protein
MGVGQGGDIDRIDIVRVDDRIGVVVPAWHLVTPGEILCQCAIAPHHGDEG